MYNFKESITRQLDLIPTENLGKAITIVGAGAAGSWASLALAKMGFINQTVMDYDTVDTVNLNCQFFPYHAIGKPKVEALHAMIKDFTGFDIQTKNKKWEGDQFFCDIVISATDSMAVRKAMFETCTARWFIDSRMASEFLTVYIVDMNDKERKAEFEKTLHSDDDAVQEVCTAKSTIYCANVVGAMIAKAVKSVACGQPYAKSMSLDLKNDDYVSFK